MTQFAAFTEPEDGDRYSPKDNLGHVIVVKVKGIKRNVPTSRSPEGKDAVVVDLLDLDLPKGSDVFHDVLIFGGSFVDGFLPYLDGQLLVTRIDQKTAKSGNPYACPKPATSADTARAQSYFAANGDPFAASFATVKAEPPF